MKIYLGTDHRGFELKEALKDFLAKKGYTVEDKGAHTLDPDDDYPDFILPVARAVAKNPNEDRGIVLGYSGQGEAMAANRIDDVRAAVFYGGPEKIITLSRQHNDSNVLSLGAGFVDEHTAKRVVDLWLNTPFSNKERYENRIDEVEEETDD